MPVSEKAANKLAREFTGGLFFNTIDDVARLGPLAIRETVSIEEYEEQFHGVWERLVDSIDWNRVLIETSAEHRRQMAADEDHGDPLNFAVAQYDSLGGTVCPDCLVVALKARERTF